jgi:Flp pilus assembly protein TadB
VREKTRPKRRLRWDEAPRALPKHPYRDSAIVYAALAGVVVGVTALTGGNMRAALTIAPAIFVVATAYSWWRWRQREREREGAEHR